MRFLKNFFFSFIVTPLIVSAGAHAVPVGSRDTFVSYDQIILFGDSITQGSSEQGRGFAFAPALQHAYIRRHDVLNRGFNGYTTLQGLAVLPQFFPTPQRDRVRIMTVFFGANDAVLPPGDQHVPLETYKESLKAIVTHDVVNAQKTKILLLTPPPVNEYQLEPNDFAKGLRTLSRTATNTRIYADACREVGNSLGIPVVDIWSAFMKQAGWTEGQPLAGSKSAPANEKLAALLSDGLHFTPAGYQVMYNEVITVIQQDYPEEMPENVPIHFPAWNTWK